MTPASRRRSRRKRVAAVAAVAAFLLPLGARAASGEDAAEAPREEPSPQVTTATASADPSPSPSPSPSPLPDAPPKSPDDPYRLRARVKPGPGSDFGGAKAFPEAMGKVKDGSCAQTHNLLWDGEPTASRVKLKMIRQQGDPETAAANPPSATCAAKEQRKSGYKLRVKVSYPTPSGDRKTTGRVRLPKAFTLLAEKMNAMRDRVLLTGTTARFKLKLIRVKKKVPGMIGGLATRYGVSVSKALSVAKCESGYNPKAYNPAGPWAGVYQQDTDYWAQRAKKFGHPGESVFQAYANIDVSLKMARSMGWSHWACA
jgi:hypothetical protein